MSQCKTTKDILQEKRSALALIAAGCIFSHISFSIGAVNLNWIGYTLILSCLDDLKEDVPETELLRPLACGLGIWYGAKAALGLLGIKPDIYAAELVASVLALYFHFQLLTDLAAFARIHGWAHHRQILRLRSVRTVLMTLTSVSALTPLLNENGPVLYATAAVHVAITLWIVTLLWLLRRHICPPARENGPSAERPDVPWY